MPQQILGDGIHEVVSYCGTVFIRLWEPPSHITITLHPHNYTSSYLNNHSSVLSHMIWCHPIRSLSCGNDNCEIIRIIETIPHDLCHLTSSSPPVTASKQPLQLMIILVIISLVYQPITAQYQVM